jgi:hypothetical protein
MASSVNISGLFSQLKEAQAPPEEDVPDWLLEDDTQVRARPTSGCKCRHGHIAPLCVIACLMSAAGTRLHGASAKQVSVDPGPEHVARAASLTDAASCHADGTLYVQEVAELHGRTSESSDDPFLLTEPAAASTPPTLLWPAEQVTST